MSEKRGNVERAPVEGFRGDTSSHRANQVAGRDAPFEVVRRLAPTHGLNGAADVLGVAIDRDAVCQRWGALRARAADLAPSPRNGRFFLAVAVIALPMLALLAPVVAVVAVLAVAVAHLPTLSRLHHLRVLARGQEGFIAEMVTLETAAALLDGLPRERAVDLIDAYASRPDFPLLAHEALLDRR